MQGVETIYIDPKADAKPLANLTELGDTRVLDLRNGNDGILDPFAMGEDDSEKILFALETISLLIGELPGTTVSILEPIISKLLEEGSPSLSKVTDHLLASSDPTARGLGSNLKIMRQLPFARLCFSPKGGDAIVANSRLTVITLLGLDMPDAETPKSDYSTPNRLAVAVMYLLTSMTKNLMVSRDPGKQKAVIIDEAWAVVSTAAGRKVIQEIARMGRSLNTALVLVSQNADDFVSDGLINSVSTKLAFATKGRNETESLLRLFSLEPDQSNMETMTSLNTGECLMMDADARISRVQVANWNRRWTVAFDTNPDSRKSTTAKGHTDSQLPLPVGTDTSDDDSVDIDSILFG